MPTPTADGRVPGGRVIEGPDGRLQFVPDNGQVNAPSLLLSPGQSAPERVPQSREGAESALRTIGGLIGDGLMLGTSLVQPEVGALGIGGRAALRFGLDSAAGAASGALHGDNPVESGVLNGALGAGGEALGHGTAYLGNRTALALGGLGKEFTRSAGEVTDAFMRTRDRYNPLRQIRRALGLEEGIANPIGTGRAVGISVGNPVRMERARKAVGGELEQLERATPGEIPHGTGLGSVDELLKKTPNTAYPIDNAKKLIKTEEKIFDQQATIRGKASLRNPQGSQTGLTVREAGELHRGLNHEAEDFLHQVKQPGARYTTADMTENQAKLAYGKANQDAKFAVADQTTLPGQRESQGARIRRRDKEFSDLATMESANRTLRDEGRGLSVLSSMGGRGGMGAMVGMSLANLTGTDRGTGAALGGLGGILASPVNISRFGNTLGRGLEYSPILLRLLNAAEDAQNLKDNVSGVRRRNP